MGVIEILTLALTHPQEFRILLQFWNYHERKRDITRKEEHATSGWDRPAMRRCWELLDFTSRSFAVVIKELEGDLARVVSSFVSSVASRTTLHTVCEKNQSNFDSCLHQVPSLEPCNCALVSTRLYLTYN